MTATLRYLSIKQVAELTGCHVNLVQRWIKEGVLRAHDVGSVKATRPTYRISIEDLEAFLECRSSTEAPKPKRRRRKRGAVTEYF
jgi:excisionase family DNA binding protein